MRKPSFRPWFECLEERTNPGVVTVSFAAGTLTLTGSTGADSIAISQPGFGQITLTPDGTTGFNVGGVNLGLGNAATFGTAAAPVKALTANLGLGNDTFNVDLATSLSLQGSVSVNLGAGTNQLYGAINSNTNNTLNVGGSLTIAGGSGVDSINADNFNVAGNVAINAGDGNNQITTDFNVGGAGPPTCFVQGALTITQGIGAATMLFFEVQVQGLTTINLGSSVPANSAVGSNVTFSDAGAGIAFNGGLKITTAATNVGAETITFQNTVAGVAIGGAGLGITTTGGNDVIDLSGVINTAGTLINTGAGNDSVLLDGPTTTSTFAGPFQMNTGDGNDTVEIGNAGPVDFLNSVSVQMGAGNDSLTLATTGPVGFSAGFLAVFDGGGGLTGGFNQKTANAANVTGPLPQLRNFF
jgi:hypothetical protein